MRNARLFSTVQLIVAHASMVSLAVAPVYPVYRSSMHKKSVGRLGDAVVAPGDAAVGPECCRGSLYFEGPQRPPRPACPRRHDAGSGRTGVRRGRLATSHRAPCAGWVHVAGGSLLRGYRVRIAARGGSMSSMRLGRADVAGLAAATDTVRMASAWAAGLRVLRAVNHESGDGTDE